MHVLVIEDSHRLRETLQTGLSRSGYAVDAAADGAAGLNYALHNPYDVIVLDLMLPGMDGLTLLQRLRESGVATHVLILSARASVDDRVLGLREGADDYLVKPFSFDELLARIEALVRRRYDSKSPVLNVGHITVDTGARTVHIDGQQVDLSRREYALIEYLARRAGHVVTRREIEDHLYSEHDLPMSNAVDRIVCTLRPKIRAADGRQPLVTRRGEGFILEEAAT